VYRFASQAVLPSTSLSLTSTTMRAFLYLRATTDSLWCLSADVACALAVYLCYDRVVGVQWCAILFDQAVVELLRLTAGA
jgi:hypothetical protein